MPKKVTNKSESKKATPRSRREKGNGRTPMQTAGIAAVPPISEERIRARAYEIFRAGWNPRDPVADWIQAERELRAESGS